MVLFEDEGVMLLLTVSAKCPASERNLTCRALYEKQGKRKDREQARREENSI